jgi:RNA polymerase sigma factor (sigma-70 family)
MAARRLMKCSRVSSALTLEDAFQAGVIGAIKAAQLWDPERLAPRTGKPVKFVTYMVHAVNQNIFRAADNAALIRVPTHLTSNVDKSLSGGPQHGFYGKRGHLIERAMRARLVMEIPETVEPEGREQVLAMDAVALNERRALVLGALHWLTAREKEVIRRRFGLHGVEPEHLDVIGADLGLTRERIRQIQRKALEKLRWTPEAMLAERA